MHDGMSLAQWKEQFPRLFGDAQEYSGDNTSDLLKVGETKINWNVPLKEF